jgi:hypothetical protein
MIIIHMVIDFQPRRAMMSRWGVPSSPISVEFEVLKIMEGGGGSQVFPFATTEAQMAFALRILIAI